MIKPFKITTLLMIIIIGFSCSNPKKSINHIWIGDYELTLYFDDSLNLHNELNELLDFSSPDSGFIKYFPSYNANKIHWSLDNNILSIDSTNFRIVTITEDSLVLSPYLVENKKPKPDTSNAILKVVPIQDTYYIYKRFKNKPLSYDTLTAFNTISNKIWKRVKNVDKKGFFFDWYEFLDNGVSITKIINDSSNHVHLQDDCWRIESYKDNLFLVFYSTPIQGNWYYKYQIYNLNDTTLQIALNDSETATFKSQLVKNNSKIENQFIGDWTSQNDTSKFYGRHIPKRFLATGYQKLFDGTLNYRFKKDTLIISCDDIKLKCKWYLSLDNSILFFEHPINEEYYKGVYVQYSYILNLDSNNFSIELFDNNIQTGKDKPNTLILNWVQDFKRIQ